MTFLELVTLSAATWYVSYVVTNLSGPFGIFDKLREFKGGRWHGRSAPKWIENPMPQVPTYEQIPNHDGLLDCIICSSVWVAFALLLLTGHNDLIDAFAVAGVAILVHGFTGWRHNIN